MYLYYFIYTHVVITLISMKVKVNSCIYIWFVNVFMGIKMPNFVQLTAGCPIFTVNMGITM